MKYYEDKDITLYHGKMQEELKNLEDESIDSIVCDPPYELNFMGKGWDNSGVAFQPDTWKECLRVLKPGGYLLAFGGSRTYHRICCAIEDAGFEIRDCIMWLYGSGFPKGTNVGLTIDKINGTNNKTGNKLSNGKATNSGSGCYNMNNGKVSSIKRIYEERIAKNEWKGYNTQLKPAYEPIIMARKPTNLTIAQNCLTYGVGAINIDECRVGLNGGTKKTDVEQCTNSKTCYGDGLNGGGCESINAGRFPTNVITDGSDEVASGMPNSKSTYNENNKHSEKLEIDKDRWNYGYAKRIDSGFNDEGSAMRYFYTAKASRKDRDDGLMDFEEKQRTDGCIRANSESARMYGANSVVAKNIHPTVKPIELMQYLVRLVTPKGTENQPKYILDCFMGSGSTGKATMFENRERNAHYHFIGVEMTDEYLPIAKARIIYGRDIYEYEMKKQEKETGQCYLDLWEDENES